MWYKENEYTTTEASNTPRLTISVSGHATFPTLADNQNKHAMPKRQATYETLVDMHWKHCNADGNSSTSTMIPRLRFYKLYLVRHKLKHYYCIVSPLFCTHISKCIPSSISKFQCTAAHENSSMTPQQGAQLYEGENSITYSWLILMQPLGAH